MSLLPQRIILWDTEYTTWEGAQEREWSGPNEFKELVQIGASLWNTHTFVEEDSLLLFVRPVRNPLLSDYFSELTGVTQNDIDRCGTDFKSAAEKFRKWIKDFPCYAYGHDKHVLDINFVLADIPNTFDDAQFYDVREIFEEAGIDTSRFMSSTIPEAFGIQNPHRGHDALGDARSIALALAELIKGTPLLATAKIQ